MMPDASWLIAIVKLQNGRGVHYDSLRNRHTLEAIVKIYLTPADAARILGVTPSAVRLMTGRGELQIAATTESGIRLFDRADVKALAKKRAEQAERDDG